MILGAWHRIPEANFRLLPDRQERSLAHMAVLARHDVYCGAAQALVLAERLRRMRSGLDYAAVISQAYTSSRGLAPDYLAYECPECGSVHAGCDAALHCCRTEDVDELE